MTPLDIIAALAQYGGWAALVFTTGGFVWGIVMPSKTHEKIIAIYLTIITARDKRIEQLERENDRLWTIATQSSSQAARAMSQLSEEQQPWPPPLPSRQPRRAMLQDEGTG